MPRRLFHRRSRSTPRGKLRWVAVLGLCLIGLLYYRPVGAYLHTRDALAQRSAEVQKLVAEKGVLEQRLAATHSGATLVRVARRLGLVKPGERLFIVKGIPEWRRAHATPRAR